MKKIIISENERRRILNKHYGDVNQELFEYLKTIFNVSNDLMFHNLTDGKANKIDFVVKYTDVFGEEITEYFRYLNNKKELKEKIVNFLSYDPKVYTILQIGGFKKLVNLIQTTENDSEVELYKNEMSNQMNIHMDEIEPPLNLVVKKFLDFYIK
jgi:hypothetical protein